jgi:pimeloyl-ACP methyl ester carboxylesterase
VPLGNLQVHYEVRGQGSPLLMIMGWRANLDWWPRALLESLEKRHRLILYDNRGAGRTGDPGGRFRMEQLADDAVALLDALAIPRAHVFGVSMGGMVAQELALRHPARVDRLILACTHPGGLGGFAPTPAMRRAWRHILFTRWPLERRLAYLLFSRDMPKEDPAFWKEFRSMVDGARITEWASTKQFLAIAQHHSRERVASIRAPTLVLAGDSDLMISPDNSRWLAAHIPGARLELVAGAGHAFLHEYGPRVDALLAEFLKDG